MSLFNYHFNNFVMENNNNKKSSKGSLLIAVLCLIIGLLVGVFFLNGKTNVSDQQGAALSAKTANTSLDTYNPVTDSKKYELSLEQSEKLNSVLLETFSKFTQDNDIFNATDGSMNRGYRFMCFIFGNGGPNFVYYSNSGVGNCIHISYY